MVQNLKNKEWRPTAFTTGEVQKVRFSRGFLQYFQLHFYILFSDYTKQLVAFGKLHSNESIVESLWRSPWRWIVFQTEMRSWCDRSQLEVPENNDRARGSVCVRTTMTTDWTSGKHPKRKNVSSALSIFPWNRYIINNLNAGVKRSSLVIIWLQFPVHQGSRFALQHP